MRKYLGFIPFLSLLLLTGCDNSPVFELEPKIEFVDIQPREIVQNEGELTLTFHYQDGDGDLGDIDTDTQNLFIKDMRPAFDTLGLLTYSIPNLTPDTKNPSIQGEIDVQIPAPFLSAFISPPGPDEEDVIFTLWLYDRTGNMSNVIETAPVTIKKN